MNVPLGHSDGRRWSTPLGEYRNFDGARLPGYGEARWREPTGEWTYAEFWLQRIAYNVVAGEMNGTPHGLLRGRAVVP